MSDVTIYAPSPILTVTVEDHPSGNEVHVHAGGQGVWQARMLRRLGMEVTLCAVLSGETGGVLRHLIEDEGLRLVSVAREGRGAAYVHDRRAGERREIVAEQGDPLGRHELDELYSVMIREGLETKLVVLSGPAGDDVLPAETYRRLASDLRTVGARVVVDLAGDRMDAAVAGGVDVLKVSHEELLDAGLISEPTEEEICAAMRSLRSRGAECVIVTRASDPSLFHDEHGVLEVTAPQLETTDTHGAGDSLTAGIVAGMSRGQSAREAVILGAAAGALNVTRHGLGTADAGAVAKLQELITTRIVDDGAEERAEGRSNRESTDDADTRAEGDE